MADRKSVQIHHVHGPLSEVPALAFDPEPTTVEEALADVHWRYCPRYGNRHDPVCRILSAEIHGQSTEGIPRHAAASPARVWDRWVLPLPEDKTRVLAGFYGFLWLVTNSVIAMA